MRSAALGAMGHPVGCASPIIGKGPVTEAKYDWQEGNSQTTMTRHQGSGYKRRRMSRRGSKEFFGDRLDKGCNIWGVDAIQVPEFVEIDLVGTLATKNSCRPGMLVHKEQKTAQGALTVLTEISRKRVNRVSHDQGYRSCGLIVTLDLGCGRFMRWRRTEILG